MVYYVDGFPFRLSRSLRPLALYCQETEEGVSEANVGTAASLYISISNIGAAVLPVLFPLLFKTNLLNFIAVLGGLILCRIMDHRKKRIVTSCPRKRSAHTFMPYVPTLSRE